MQVESFLELSAVIPPLTPDFEPNDEHDWHRILGGRIEDRCRSNRADIEGKIRDIVLQRLNRKGVVIAISGGIDSSVVAALCFKALGTARVLGLMLPEADSSPDSLHFANLLRNHWVFAGMSRTLPAF